MTVFGIVRGIFALFGVFLVGQALFGVPYALAERQWTVAGVAFVGGIIGVWLVRVGVHGTFSGEPDAPMLEREGRLRESGTGSL